MGKTLLLPFMLLIAAVLTELNRKQWKRAIGTLICVSLIYMNIPSMAAEETSFAGNSALYRGQVLVNGINRETLDAVTYTVSEETEAQTEAETTVENETEIYTIDSTSTQIRVRNGDRISFSGTIYAPEGERISWIRVDIYDANTEVPYTVGGEYYRMEDMNVPQFDLANIPPLTIGEVFGTKGYKLAEGGKYIVMFSVGDTNGNGFADRDDQVEDDQGPAVLVQVLISPANCDHPHSNFEYILHSSGETRKKCYGDSMTHQVEPLFERYCGLCGTFLMNIWGQGTPEEHVLDVNGVCMDCGYYDGIVIPEDDELSRENAGSLEALYRSVIGSTNPDRQVNVVAFWENEKLAVGDMLTLTAQLTGYENLNYTIFWQCDKGSGYEDVEVATGHPSIQFMVDEENMLWRWRAGVNIDVEIPEAEEGDPIIDDGNPDD